MQLTSEQKRVLGRILAVGRQVGASPKELKAAVETGIVEANLTNPPGGDRDSQGWRQERASLYPDPQNLEASIRRFYKETRAVRGKYGSAGDLAAAVQRPAAQYRGRYQQNSGLANSLIAQYGGMTVPAATGGAASGRPAATAATVTVSENPAMVAVRRQIALQMLAGRRFDPVRVATQIAAAGPATVRVKGGTGSSQPTTAGPVDAVGSVDPKGLAKGTAMFEGHRVAAWIAPILTMARKKGWTGQVNSGFRTYGEQQRIWNSGVRPAARPGTSNHENPQYPGGAIDVSNAEQLSRIIGRSKYKDLLVWAGAKDPVHFSHPHNGSY